MVNGYVCYIKYGSGHLRRRRRIHYSAAIPPQPAGTSVEYCITTSTVDLTQVATSGIIDSLTLSTSPHSHYVVAPGSTPTATPSPTPSPTSLPTAAPPPTPVLSGLTYNGGTPFVNGTNLVAGTSYTIMAQANPDTQSVVFTTNGKTATASLPPFSFTFTAPTTNRSLHTYRNTVELGKRNRKQWRFYYSKL